MNRNNQIRNPKSKATICNLDRNQLKSDSGFCHETFTAAKPLKIQLDLGKLESAIFWGY